MTLIMMASSKHLACQHFLSTGSPCRLIPIGKVGGALYLTEIARLIRCLASTQPSKAMTGMKPTERLLDGLIPKLTYVEANPSQLFGSHFVGPIFARPTGNASVVETSSLPCDECL